MNELAEPTFAQAVFLAFAALTAGFIDAIAGGGGIITLPALLAVGLPPHLALGTNKAQSVFGSSAALGRFAHAGLVDRSRAPISFVLGFAGSLAGAALVLVVKPAVLKPLVLVLLSCVAIFLTFRRGAERPIDPVPMSRARAVSWIAAIIIGAYDGFFGPGTGTFLILVHVALAGETMQRASANAKVVNFASNLAAFALFSFNGKVVWAFALPMAIAQLCGGILGAHATVKVGDVLVRRVVLIVVLALILKMGADLILG